MTEEKKALTSGNVRLIIILGFILALAIVFQSQIKNTMANGCFDLSLGYEELGIKMSDKSYCTKEDMVGLAGDLVETGAESVRIEADSVVTLYEARLLELAGKNEELSIKIRREMELINELTLNKKRFNRYMSSQVNNPDKAAVAREINNVFQELFQVIPTEEIVYQEIQTQSPEQIKVQNAEIRSDFDTRSRVKVEKINESIRIKK